MKKLLSVIFVFILLSCGTENKPIYTLTTTVVGEGSVTPTSGEYEEGEAVMLTGRPSQHWVFDSWSGDASGSSSQLSITMDGDKNIVGNFSERLYPLIINVDGDGNVEEEVIQSKGEHTFGTVVQLTATPSTGWKFIEWTGAINSTDNVIQVTVNEEMYLKVTFVRLVDQYRLSMYAKMHQNFAYRTEYFVAPSAFTDETRVRQGASRYMNLNTAVGTAGTTHIASWNAHYDIIQDANILIRALEDGGLQASDIDRIRAEALTIRAFALHNLVKVYGYDPGNFDQGPEANWDAGVVISTDPDDDLRPRSSVNEVYTQILKDLNDARNLADNLDTNNSFITPAFIDGLTARSYLYAADWLNAAQYAQSAIDKFSGSLQDTPDDVANMFNENFGNHNHPEAFFKVVVNSNTDRVDWGNNGPGTYTSDGFVAQIPTQFLVDKYDEGDYRLMGWYRDCAKAARIPLVEISGCDAVNDSGFSLVKFNGAKGQHVDDLPFMRLAEMYLILAEAQYKTGNTSEGIATLKKLRDARNAGATPTAFRGVEAFEDFILDERMRELALEGHRFFDLKRLRRDIYNPNGSVKMLANSYRILPPLGSALRNNPLLVENPNYGMR